MHQCRSNTSDASRMSRSELRIGVITDIHAGPDHGSQLGSYAFVLLEGFMREMEEFGPDLVVDLGDRVNNVGPVEDALVLRELVEKTRSLRHAQRRVSHVRYVPGNHDLVHLSLEDNEEITLQSQRNRLEVWQGWPVLFLNTEAAEPDVEGLLTEVPHTSRSVLVVFSHRPLVPVPLARNPLFPPGEPQNPPWGPALVDELVELGWTPFCVNGHLHWNHVLVGRASTHITVGSLVEAWECAGRPSGSFAEVVVTPVGREVAIEVHVMGRLACHYRFEVREEVRPGADQGA